LRARSALEMTNGHNSGRDEQCGKDRGATQ